MKKDWLKSTCLVGISACLAIGAAACTRSARFDTPTSPITIPELTQPVELPAEEEDDNGSLPVELAPSGNVETTPTITPVKYAVTFLADGEILNVRSGPGVTFDIVGSLAANAHNIRATGQREMDGEVSWMEIFLDESMGWVSGAYLTEEKEGGEVCNDPQIGVLLDGFTQAVRDKDGVGLAKLASPVHGLTIHHELWNPPVTLGTSQEVQSFFTSSEEYDWGFHSGSGEPLAGTIQEMILPELENVLLQNHTRHCNTLERGVSTGSTTGYVFWPYDYAAFNYISMYRSAPPEQEQDWRSWVAGIEYVDGKPYIVVLIQFYWEI